MKQWLKPDIYRINGNHINSGKICFSVESITLSYGAFESNCYNTVDGNFILLSNDLIIAASLLNSCEIQSTNGVCS